MKQPLNHSFQSPRSTWKELACRYDGGAWLRRYELMPYAARPWAARSNPSRASVRAPRGSPDGEYMECFVLAIDTDELSIDLFSSNARGRPTNIFAACAHEKSGPQPAFLAIERAN
jgi:hypothetical protein